MQPIKRPLKRYNNRNVPWHTHLYRAALALMVKGEKPWHTHIYRSAHSLAGNPRYAPRPRRNIPMLPSTLPALPQPLTTEKLSDYYASLQSRNGI